MSDPHWSETAAADANNNMGDVPVDQADEECVTLPDVSPAVRPRQATVSAAAEAADRRVSAQLKRRDRRISAEAQVAGTTVQPTVSASVSFLVADVVVVVDEPEDSIDKEDTSD